MLICVICGAPPKNGIIMNITIRPTRLEELGQVMPFYERARRFMATNGNANSGSTDTPPLMISGKISKTGAAMCL